jgi:hypothetical protein
LTLRLLRSRTQPSAAATGCILLKGQVVDRKNRWQPSNKNFDTGVVCFVFTFFHNFGFNLSLTCLLQGLDRIYRYFKAKFSALIR